MHPPNTTCNHLITPAAAADSTIPFVAADQDDDICSSSIITNNCNDSCDLINFPINSSPNSLYYPEIQNSINYLQFLEDFYQQYQCNYDYPNPSPDPPPAAAAAAGYHHHHYQSDEIVPPLPPPPPPPLNMRPLENSDNNKCSTNENNNGNTNNYGKSKRTCKKDRHSKIHTSKGLRDRRMRLSLDVARKFFRLQDLLGFDKASRTVDWLLTNSDNAIRDLTTTTDLKAGVNSGSCTSEDVLEETPEMPSENKAAEKKKRGARKGKPTATATAERARVGRESRRKARERARERTSQKRRLSLRCQSNRTSTQQEKLRLGFAESSEKEYSGNGEASWNNSYGYLHCTADAAWI